MKYKIEAQDIIEQTPPSNDVKVPLFEQRPTLFCHRLHDLTAVLAVMRFGQKRIWTDGEAVLSARHACLPDIRSIIHLGKGVRTRTNS